MGVLQNVPRHVPVGHLSTSWVLVRHPIFHFRHSVTSQKSQDLPSLYQAISSACHGRQSPPVHYQLSTLRSARSFTSTPPPQIRSERNYVTSKTETETENRFWPYPKPKNRFYRTNPVLETLSPIFQYSFIKKMTKLRWPIPATVKIFLSRYYELAIS